MIIYAVIDTNVLVSALLSNRADAATVQLMGRLIGGEIVPVYSSEIMREYRNVLSRRKFKFDLDMINYILSTIEKYGVLVEPSDTGALLPDMKDLPFYEVVMKKRDDDAYLVTGNLKHFPIKPFIVTARQMIDILNVRQYTKINTNAETITTMNKECTIRQATLQDLDEIATLEKICFPEKEAASKASFSDRLSVYANHFWLLEKDGHIVSMVNGMVTDDSDLQDKMYHNAKMHDEHGKWQMIFGVETHPDYQRRGYAAMVINKVIEEAKLQNRDGVVLTCKEHMLHYYEKFGFVNEGISGSEHGDAVWYQMRLNF